MVVYLFLSLKGRQSSILWGVLCSFKHPNCSHSSLKVVVFLFLSLKGRQSSILWGVLCSFHSFYHCCHSLSLIAICCHSLYYSLSLFVTCCTTLCHSLYHSLSLVVTRCTTRLSFYKRSAIWDKFIWDWFLVFALSVFLKNLFISKPWFLIRHDTVWRLMWPF